METVWKNSCFFLSTREDSRYTPPIIFTSFHLKPETFTFFLPSPSQAFSGFYCCLFSVFPITSIHLHFDASTFNQCLKLFRHWAKMFNICGRVPPQRTAMGRMGRITHGTRASRKTPTCFPASRTGPNLNLCTDLMNTPTISNSTSPSTSRTGLISAALWITCSRSSAMTTSRTLHAALRMDRQEEATPWCPPANPLQPST